MKLQIFLLVCRVSCRIRSGRPLSPVHPDQRGWRL